MLCFSYSRAAVIGVDLGGEFFKSTLVKPGYPFTIVENTASQRKTATAMAFTKEERVYGSAAVMKSSSIPTHTFMFVRDLIGMKYSDAIQDKTLKKYNLVEDVRGYVAFNVELKEEGEMKSYIFTIEEILGMILKHARDLAEIQSSGIVLDIFLTVPHSFTMNQRRMLNDAVVMAGMNCVGMIEENSAVAITYGIDRKDENSTHSVLFLNLGSTNFEASVVNYFARAENITDKLGNIRKGEVVQNIDVTGHASSSDISGRHFDTELLNILAEEFNSLKSRQGKTDIRENPRIMNRLYKEVNKIKETLSANKEKSVLIPEVADYINLKTKITRPQFEESIEKYMHYLKTTVAEVLRKSDVTIEELSAVEIVGGALRVPKVKDFLASLIGDHTLGSHINGDEAMTFGAAFIGANSSSSFKARKLFLHDTR